LRETEADDRELQLELPMQSGGAVTPSFRARLRSGRATAASAGAAAFGWLPLFALFGIFAQIAWLGLAPALRERDRLDEQTVVVETRSERLATANALHRTRLAALADPVFQERVARARRSARFASPPRPLDLPLSPLGPAPAVAAAAEQAE